MPSYCRLRRRDRRRERGGLHAEVAQNGGFSWGFQRMFDIENFGSSVEMANLSLLGFDVYDNNHMLLALPEEQIYTKDEEYKLKASGLVDNDPNVLSILAHGNPYGIGDNDGVRISADEFIDALKLGKFGYKGQKMIRFYSCNLAAATKDGRPNFATLVANGMNVTVIAATTYVDIERENTGRQLTTVTLGIKEGKFFREGIGVWVKCQRGKGCLPYLDAYGKPY